MAPDSGVPAATVGFKQLSLSIPHILSMNHLEAHAPAGRYPARPLLWFIVLDTCLH